MAGSVAASAAVDAGQPLTAPLWLNSQRPWPNGAAACSPAAVPGVADQVAGGRVHVADVGVRPGGVQA